MKPFPVLPRRQKGHPIQRFEPTTKKPGEYVLTGDGKLVMVGEGR